MLFHKKSAGLKPLKAWVAILVPPVLLLTAWNTYFRDLMFRWFLPRRTYTKYIFVPRDKALIKKSAASDESFPKAS